MAPARSVKYVSTTMVLLQVLRLAFVVPLLLATSIDTRYQGKPVQEWASELRSNDMQVRRTTSASMKTVAPGGGAIVPALGAALKDADVRHLAVDALATLSRQFAEAFRQLS